MWNGQLITNMISTLPDTVAIGRLSDFLFSAGINPKTQEEVTKTLMGIYTLFTDDPRFIGVRPMPYWRSGILPSIPLMRYQLCYEKIGLIEVRSNVHERVKEKLGTLSYAPDHISESYFQSNLRPGATTIWASMAAEATATWLGDIERLSDFAGLAMQRFKGLTGPAQSAEQLHWFLRNTMAAEFEMSFMIAEDGSRFRAIDPKSELDQAIALSRFNYWKGRFFELLAEARG